MKHKESTVEVVVGLGLCQGRSSTRLEIDRYVFFGADTDISAIHGPTADISKFLISCFLLHYQKHDVFYALPFFQKLQKSGLS